MFVQLGDERIELLARAGAGNGAELVGVIIEEILDASKRLERVTLPRFASRPLQEAKSGRVYFWMR